MNTVVITTHTLIHRVTDRERERDSQSLRTNYKGRCHSPQRESDLNINVHLYNFSTGSADALICSLPEPCN